MKILLFLISLYALKSESTDILKLNLYGQKQFSGGKYLYLPLAGYDKEGVSLSVSFDNGRSYKQFYIYYRQSNDLNISTPNITKITYSSRSIYRTSHTFYFTIKLTSVTDYLIIYVPTFTNAPITTMTVSHIEYSESSGSGMIIFWIIFICLFILIIVIFIFICRMMNKKNGLSSSKIEDKGPTIPDGPIYAPQPSYPQQPIY